MTWSFSRSPHQEEARHARSHNAVKVRAPLKAIDRLLSNPHLHAERVSIYADVVKWLIPQPRPIIIVDGSDATRDQRWQLLCAAVPVGGRMLTVLKQVVPQAQLACPRIEREFLKALNRHDLQPAHADRAVVS